MTIDIDRVRGETPGVAEAAHFGAAGSALPPAPVLNTVVEFLNLEARVGGYEAARLRAPQLAAVYDEIAALIGAGSDEIAQCENASVAWAHAFYALDLKPGDRILTGHAEYAANYVAFLHRAKRDGVEIDVAPSDVSGATDPAALEAMIGPRTKLIALTWIPTNGGLVNPAAAIGEIAARRGVPYLLDACQAVGQMPVDVTALNCDFLSATGRKFLRGPRGTGFLYVRRRWLEQGLEPAMIDHYGAPWTGRGVYELRSDAKRFETWESAQALRAGLGAAIAYARAIGLEAIQQRAWGLADGLRERLRDLKGAAVRDLGSERCAIVSFTLEGVEARQAVESLRENGVMIGASQPSSTRIDSEARDLPMLLRAAPHYYNTEAELDRLIEALAALKR